MGNGTTDAVLGMVPTVLAIGILKKTTDMISSKPVGRKIGLAEKKIQLKVAHGKSLIRSRLR